jgi:hypothetical protein
MNTATRIRALPWINDAALFQLDQPIELPTGQRVDYVVVSIGPRTNGDHGTLVVIADADGNVTSWAPLAVLEVDNHADALKQLGYEVAA